MIETQTIYCCIIRSSTSEKVDYFVRRYLTLRLYHTVYVCLCKKQSGKVNQVNQKCMTSWGEWKFPQTARSIGFAQQARTYVVMADMQLVDDGVVTVRKGAFCQRTNHRCRRLFSASASHKVCLHRRISYTTVSVVEVRVRNLDNACDSGIARSLIAALPASEVAATLTWSGTERQCMSDRGIKSIYPKYDLQKKIIFWACFPCSADGKEILR